MEDTLDDTDEAKFNETLKRMLKTPPTPHEKPEKNNAAQQKREGPVKRAEDGH